MSELPGAGPMEGAGPPPLCTPRPRRPPPAPDGILSRCLGARCKREHGRVYDDLQPGGRYEASVMLRSDGRMAGETATTPRGIAREAAVSRASSCIHENSTMRHLLCWQSQCKQPAPPPPPHPQASPGA
jgi:hypothetical protein